MSPLTIKLTAEQQEKYGVKTAEGVFDLLENISETHGKLRDSEQANQSLSGKIGALESRVTAIEGRKPEVDSEALFAKLLPKIQEAAKAEASREAMASIAKVGGHALTTKETPADVTQGKTDEQKAAEAGDYKAQWKASSDLQAEFVDAESYEAYRRACDRGIVKIHSRNSRN